MSLPIYQRVAVTNMGDVIPGAEVTVVNESTGLTQTVYSNRAGTTALTQPFFADSNGLIQFYIPAGVTVRVTATGGSGSYTDRYVQALHLTESSSDATATKVQTMMRSRRTALAQRAGGAPMIILCHQTSRR